MRSQLAKFSIGASLLFYGLNPTFAETVNLDGSWAAGTIVSTGIISDQYFTAVEPLAGKRITIHGQRVQLPDDVACLISDVEYEQWTNDRLTFGSFGGDWSDVGLRLTDDQNFGVARYDLECPHLTQPQLSIVTQPQHEVVLIGAYRVFVKLLPAE